MQVEKTPEVLRGILTAKPTADPVEIFRWFEKPGTEIFSDGGNLALFEEVLPGVKEGHYFFSTGNALKTAKRILSEVFETCSVIIGKTPTDNQPALKLTRRLGFSSYGIVHTPLGDAELFILRKEDFK